MKLETAARDGATLVSITQLTINYADLEKLQAELFTLIDGESSRMVIDLAQVETMDSFGVGVLMSAYRRMDRKGGALKLCGVTGRVRSTLAITKVDTVIEIFDDADAACASFEGAA